MKMFQPESSRFSNDCPTTVTFSEVESSVAYSSDASVESAPSLLKNCEASERHMLAFPSELPLPLAAAMLLERVSLHWTMGCETVRFEVSSACAQ